MVISRINVSYIIPDARAGVARKQFEALGFLGRVKAVELVDSYLIDAQLKAAELKKAEEALVNPQIERALVNEWEQPEQLDWVVEIGFLPGVRDNVGATAREVIEGAIGRKLKPGEAVYTFRAYFISGKLKLKEVQKIADSLYNPLIQTALVKSGAEFKQNPHLTRRPPKVKLDRRSPVSQVDLSGTDEELTLLGKAGILDSNGERRGPLALGLDYLLVIREYFKQKKRRPTDIELEALAQTWSEHCKHTIFSNPLDELKDGLYKTYIKGATKKVRAQKGKRDFCVSVFSDNSGAIEFDQDFLVTHKVETHNSPSALDPFGGAITGIVGVNRDTLGFGLGAKPIANLYGFCVADPSDEQPLFRDEEKKEKMLSPRRILEGVVKGVNSGGNCSGIPTAQGFLYFNKRYKGKPLVFAGTVGLIPKKSAGRQSYKKKAQPGDYVVMLGGRVGLDGIHGATFSSEGLDEGSPATAVQIGDPITQKKFSDAIVREARDEKLFNSITDNGAGGLSCSVAEMAQESNGCLVNLEKVPLKYPGLAPWQIWISESQERMTLAVPPAKWKRFEELMKKRGVEATRIGRFTNSGHCLVKYGTKKVMDIDLEFLHNGLPERQLKTRRTRAIHQEPPHKLEGDLTVSLRKMLARLNIASFEFVSKQYDHEVLAGSVMKPLQGRGLVNGEASVIRPRLDSRRGLVLASGMYPTYSDIDTYWMAAASIDAAIRNTVAAGGGLERLALLDNFCWCSSDEPERLYQLKQAAKACYDFAVAYGAPFISGKDSMFNDFKGFDHQGKPVKISVPPTLLISAISVVDDVYKTVSLDFKGPGDLIYILGETHDELGASEYFAFLSDKAGQDYVGNRVPQVEADKNLRLYRALARLEKQGLAASAISVGRGGLGVALAKAALAGGLGADVKLDELPGSATRDDFKLFSESQGRVLISVNPKKKRAVEAILKEVPYALMGEVSKTPQIKVKEGVRLSLEAAGNAYRDTFKGF